MRSGYWQLPMDENSVEKTEDFVTKEDFEGVMADSYVAVVNVRDDFFNDPFFKDWWSDFERPVSVLDTPGKMRSGIYQKNVFRLFKMIKQVG